MWVRAVNVTNMLVIAMIISFVHAANWSAMWQHQQPPKLPLASRAACCLLWKRCGDTTGRKQIFAGQILHNIRFLLIEMGKDKTVLVMQTAAMLPNSSDVSHETTAYSFCMRLLIDILFVLDR